jgi:hypothetical protein
MFCKGGDRRQGIAMIKDTGARYAIEVEGVVRTHRHDMTNALDAAVVLGENAGHTLVRTRGR